MMRRRANRLNAAMKRLGDRYALALGLAVTACVAFLTWVVVQAVNSVPFTDPYRAGAVVPADAPILRPGDEVRVAGRRAGQVREVTPASDGRLIEFDLDEGPIGRRATATVRQRGFSGSVYLLVRRGDVRQPLEEGGRIPRSQTGTTEELASVVSAFDAEAQRALQRTAGGYGGGLVGRGDDLNRLFADLPAFTRDLQPLMRGLAPRVGELSGMFRELDRTAVAFAPPGSRALGPFVTAARRTLDVTAREASTIGRFIDATPPFENTALRVLPVADPLLAESSRLARRFTGTVGEIRRALPALNGLLARDRGLRELSRFARAADPVLVRGRPLLPELEPIGRSLAPLAGPLRPFAEYLDPYADEIVQTMEWFNEFSQFRYSEGKASGARAVRFGPVFTCARPRNPFPRPGAAQQDRAANATEACR